MKKLKHTPGPWKTDSMGMYISSINDGFHVAQTRGWGHLGKLGEDKAIEIQTANARLIAVAPEMLERLLFLYNYYGFTEDKLLIEKATGLKIKDIL